MNHRVRSVWRIPAIMLIAGTMVSMAGASSLFPPPGPPQPTMKRLDQVSPARCISSLPHVISEPGRYEVCGNLDLSDPGHGITISASDVTLDLGGFTLHGGEGSQDGIHVSPGADNVTVRNGNLVGWGGDGINARDSGGELWCWGVRASFCQGNGISLTSGEIHNSVCNDNQGDGIHALSTGDNTLWCWGSSASRNGGNGITISNGGIENTVCRGNMGHGVLVDGPADGFLNESISLKNVTSVSNGSSGITVVNTPPVAVDRCEVSDNSGHGFHVTLAKGRTGRNPQTGKEIQIAAKNNTGHGVLIDVAEAMESSLHFSDSIFSGNDMRGFSITCPEGSYVTVALDRCESGSNSEEGVFVENASLNLDRCESSANGSHGFHVAFNDSSKAKTYNSTRSNRTGGISNGGSGFLVDVSSGLEAVCIFEDSSFSGNTGSGVSTLCPEDSFVDVSFRRCETNQNGEEGIRVVNAILDIDGGVCANNASHGVWLTAQVTPGLKAKTYNSSRSNKSEGVSISNNGGDGFLLEQVAMSEGEPSETLSLAFTKVEMSSNGGNGIHANGSCVVSLDSCRVNDNGDAGLRLTTSSSPEGLSKADAKRALDGFVNNASGGIVCLDANGTVEISLVEVGISHCGGNGIHFTAGENAENLSLSLDRCEVSSNAGDGIHFDASVGADEVCPSSYHLRDSVVSGNGDHLALVGFGSYSISKRARVSGSSITDNGGSGLLCGKTDHLSVGDTDSSGNGLDGMEIESAVVQMTNVSCVGNGHNGAVVDASSFQISSCLFSSNTGHGLHCPGGSGTVRSCVVSSNEGNGIRIEGSGVDVCENIVSGHVNTDGDAAGISIHGTGNRVRGNMTSGNNNGVALFANGNPIYQGSSTGGENPVYEDDDAGVSGNSADYREISTSSNPFGNIVH
ncbi:MAG: right-handed parallel beta-helix repeat-containing protein [Candidatus Sumerlaeia bacterium]|nr:right-handed parallel beta-helix repeat-containing protein [Candidatus Sumerlaeia bacterium]